MLVLGVETSCDETALCLLKITSEQQPAILSEVISSQVMLHEAYGGVVPELASREHLKNLPLLLSEVLLRSKVTLQEIDLIGVTSGPGLKGCLLMGLGFAKALALSLAKPLIAVNHIEGHALAPLLDNSELTFPYLALIVSGGHTEIQIIHECGRYELVGRTIDDAAGEAFDKSANLLGFNYPGGAALAKLADSHGRSSLTLPKVMRDQEGFSFSGLKTAISLLIKKQGASFQQDELIRGEVASAVQSAIVNALLTKLRQASERTGIYRIAITGGVAANRALREAAVAIHGAEVYFPTTDHCTDNAAMIAYTAGLRFMKGERSALSVGVMARWPLESNSLPQ